MERDMRETGKKTNNMEMVLSLGQMVHNTLGNIFWAKKKEEENLNGLMDLYLKENSMIIT
jgi:DNA-binding XRE family transcriptional regulator